MRPLAAALIGVMALIPQIVKSGNLLFLLKDNGDLIVARATRGAFEPLKTYTVSTSATWAQPAMSGNRILVKDASSVALWTVH